MEKDEVAADRQLQRALVEAKRAAIRQIDDEKSARAQKQPAPPEKTT